VIPEFPQSSDCACPIQHTDFQPNVGCPRGDYSLGCHGHKLKLPASYLVRGGFTMNLISLKANALLFALAVAALPIGMTSRASAAVLTTLTATPSAIPEGGEVTFNLHVELVPDNDTIVHMAFGFGVVNLLPFNPILTTNPTQFFVPFGLSKADFSATYIAPPEVLAGTYAPLIGLHLIYDEATNTGGFREIDVIDLRLGSLTVTATPLPAALPLFGTCLGLMGLVGWGGRGVQNRSREPGHGTEQSPSQFLPSIY
jgi:hypothetical protein